MPLPCTRYGSRYSLLVIRHWVRPSARHLIPRNDLGDTKALHKGPLPRPFAACGGDGKPTATRPRYSWPSPRLLPRAPSSASMTRGRAAATGGRSRTPRSVYLSVSHSVPLLLLGPAFPFSPVETFSLYKVLFSSSFLWTVAVGRHFRSRA